MARKHSTEPGFTIIEVLVVLTIAAFIFFIVFAAVPGLQRSLRNRQRNQDATTIFLLIGECMAYNGNRADLCRTPAQIHLDSSQLRVFTGAHYGASGFHDTTQVPPTMDEPNWLFSSRCNATGTGPLTGEGNYSYGVYYFLETKGGDNIWDNTPRCISNK